MGVTSVARSERPTRMPLPPDILLAEYDAPVRRRRHCRLAPARRAHGEDGHEGRLAYGDVSDLLTRHREQLDNLAHALLEHETLDGPAAYRAAGTAAPQEVEPRVPAVAETDPSVVSDER